MFLLGCGYAFDVAGGLAFAFCCGLNGFSARPQMELVRSRPEKLCPSTAT